MLNFVTNINFLGMPPRSRQHLLDIVDRFGAMPMAALPPAERAVADLYGVEPASVAIGIGTTEFLWLLPDVLDGPAAIPLPSFWQYEYYFKIKKGASSIVPLMIDMEGADGFQCDLEAVGAACAAGARCVFLGNANNPTGRLLDHERVLALARRHFATVFVIDETYLPFDPAWRERTLARHAADLGNLVVLQSLSKIFATPGMRIGACVTNPTLMAKIKARQTPFGVGTVALEMVPILLAEQDYLQDTPRQYAQARAWLVEQISRRLDAKLDMAPPESAFLLLRLKAGSASQVRERMRHHGVDMRAGPDLPYVDDRFLRVSVRDVPTAGVMLDALERTLGVCRTSLNG